MLQYVTVDSTRLSQARAFTPIRVCLGISYFILVQPFSCRLLSSTLLASPADIEEDRLERQLTERFVLFSLRQFHFFIAAKRKSPVHLSKTFETRRSWYWRANLSPWLWTGIQMCHAPL